MMPTQGSMHVQYMPDAMPHDWSRIVASLWSEMMRPILAPTELENVNDRTNRPDCKHLHGTEKKDSNDGEFLGCSHLELVDGVYRREKNEDINQRGNDTVSQVKVKHGYAFALFLRMCPLLPKICRWLTPRIHDNKESDEVGRNEEHRDVEDYPEAEDTSVIEYDGRFCEGH